MNIIYFNQQFIPQEDACISIMDRGFLFGDAIYEVIPFFDGTPLGLQPHLKRLSDNAKKLNIINPHTESEWKNIFSEMIKRNNIQKTSFSVYLQITRGSHPTRQHLIPANCNPTVVAFCYPMQPLDHTQTHKAILLKDTRHELCAIKSTNLLCNTLLKQQAAEQNATEAILYKKGYITECTTSNVFIVKNKQLITPSLDHNILPGITRRIVLNIAAEHQYNCIEDSISIEQLKQADEIWITSSTKEICPITILDGQPVGNGSCGDLWHTFMTLFNQYKLKDHPSEVSL
jgi:D-alanine transaminase